MFAETVAAERRARTTVEELATIEERNRLAREIHDSLGHYLTVLHVQLQLAERSLATDRDAAAAAVVRARQLTREGLEDVRRSVAALRAPIAQDRPRFAKRPVGGATARGLIRSSGLRRAASVIGLGARPR